MEEVILATFDNVKFIEGVTKMTQENWQTYFNSAIPSGVYSGLEPRNYIGTTDYNDRIIITDGEVFANGIYAKIETAEGYTDIGAVPTTARDRFICIRVYFDNEQAELVAKYNIAPEADTSSSAPVQYQSQDWLFQIQGRYFVDNDSYCCDRSSHYWELPIFYQSERLLPWEAYETAYSRGIDLRRIISLNKKKIFNEDFPGVRTSAPNYFVSGENKIDFLKTNVSASNYYVYLDPVNPPDDATFYFKNLYSGRNICFSRSVNINNSYELRDYNNYPLSKFDQINNFIGISDGTEKDYVYMTTGETDSRFRLIHLYDTYTDYVFPSGYESFRNVLEKRYFLYEAI